ncbi:MAG: FG-GAP-like repeat-containing protein [Bryobacteraceae bacterium]
MCKGTVILSFLLSIPLMAQSTCTGVNFLNAKTVNLKPSATSHINVVRQNDGTYTGFEVSDFSPYRIISTTPHFETQFGTCLPRTFPNPPAATPPALNPVGAGSQQVVSEMLPSGQYFVASAGGVADSNPGTIYFDIFDSGLQLVSETTFSSSNAGEVFYTLALADVNGDGKADLIAITQIPNGTTTDEGTPGIWVFFGNGDGTFQPGKRQALNVTAYMYGTTSFAVGDLNNDGKLDLVISLLADLTIVVALGNGDGTFTELPQPDQFNYANGPVALADLNGDGKLDLILAPSLVYQYVDAGVNVALGNGDGTFLPATYFDALNVPGYATVAVGDINGDGIPDIVTAGGTILFGDGNGGFPTREDYIIDGSGSVMLADFDGDGKMDIIVGTGNPTFLSGIGKPTYPFIIPTAAVLFGQGEATFLAAPVVRTGVNPLIAAADFDGDGIPDMAVADAFGNLTILKGKGNGEFSPVFVYNSPANVFPSTLAVADFNRDGKPDVAMFVANSDVLVFLGKGDGTFAAPLVVPFPAATYYGPGSDYLGVVDLNGDGIPDLVVSAGGAVWTALGKGDGTFTAPVLSPISLTAQNPVLGPGYYLGPYGPLAFGDFNGDGKVDIVVATTGPPGQCGITLLLGKGDGTFVQGSSTALLVPKAEFFESLSSIVAVDLNRDGRLDLAATVAGEINSLGTATLIGNGDGTFQTPTVLPVNATSVAAADMNGDGIPDLVLSGAPSPYTEYPTVILFGNGDGTFQPATQISSNASGNLLVADFNGDGSPDVAVAIPYANGVATFLNLSQPFPPLTVVSAASFAIGPLAANTVASGFGRDLATATAVATAPVLPINLAGTTVTVEDSSGVSRPAQLYFVSPGQVNFLIPAATALGSATIKLTSGDGKSVSTAASIVEFAPALFTVGSAGIAAAYAVRVGPGNVQTIEPVFTEQSGQIVPVPIDLTSPGEVYLILFGTGFDAASAASTVVNVQGVSTFVSYAGSQQQYPGLDQVNLLLPLSLAGSGVVSVVLIVAGTPANIAYVTVQ